MNTMTTKTMDMLQMKPKSFWAHDLSNKANETRVKGWKSYLSVSMQTIKVVGQKIDLVGGKKQRNFLTS